MENRNNLQKLKKLSTYSISIICLAIIYHLAARLGLLMANVQPNTSPVWPPTGIAIAALLLFGKKYWPGITLGVIFGFLFNNNALTVTIGLAIGNTLEAVVAVSLLRKFVDFHNSLDRIQDVISLAFFGGIATSLSASIGVITLLLVGVDIHLYMWTIWFTWWIGDFLGLMVITPLILVWFTHWPINWKSKKFLEGLIVIFLLLIVTSYVFTNQQIEQVAHEAMIYLIFPFIIYAALRFTQLGAVNSVTLVSGIAIYGTVIGSGPLVRGTINESLILLQTFMGVVSLTALTLSATTNQRKKAEEALQNRIEDLAKLNDSSQTFLGIFDTEKMYAAVCRIVVEKFGVNAAWIELEKQKENEVDFITPFGIDRNQINQLKGQLDHSGKVSLSNQNISETDPAISNLSNKILYLPLHFGGKTLGQLVLQSGENECFDHDKKILLASYANLAAVAIQNTWLLDQVKGGNERLHALSHRLMEVQESERLHLSRELHDESGQIISAIMVQLGLLERDANNSTLVQKYVQELKQIASDLLNNLHDMAVRLRPASLDHLGLVMAIDQYISDFGRQHNIDIQFETVGLTGKRYPLATETAIFRIIQESLTNVILHANATRVDVLLSQRKSLLNLIIEDNGIGFIPESVAEQTRLGLFGMRERVEMLEGKFTIESSLGKGTTIQVEVPSDD